ncbi:MULTISPECIES: glycosyltransferase [Sphingobacterium]|uniref:Glycosyltransferase n=1 Tax=Sphingobacterium populi TaxID=1812824 RepID=A0ABW5UE98_9SPHI|nr:glycosyltransferase [Sphingobacterium sp. CFCC 11742]
MLFSILIANYNNSLYIEEALKSVYAQTYQNWEVIIVDDASTDNSLEIVKPYLDDSRIKLFRNDKNRGCGYTKMRCAEQAIGTYCGFLDPDDSLTIDALQVMVDAFRKFPAASMINSKNVFCDENMNVIEVNPYSQDVHDKGSYLLYEGLGVTHFAVYRNELYRQTVGLSPEFTKAVDQDLFYLLDDMGTIFFVDKVLYNYRIHSGGISTFSNAMPALYQHYRVKKKAALRRLTDKKFTEQFKNLRTLLYKCDFHMAMLEKRYFKASKFLLIYTFNGGSKEVFAMIVRLFRHPSRVINSIFNVYKVK